VLFTHFLRLTPLVTVISQDDRGRRVMSPN
jgi:hypothetical protein